MKTDEQKIIERDDARAALLVAECGYCEATGLRHWEIYDHVTACRRILEKNIVPFNDPTKSARVLCSICEGKPWQAPCTACGGLGWYTP